MQNFNSNLSIPYKYKFVGIDCAVPGLPPKDITAEELQAAGLTEEQLLSTKAYQVVPSNPQGEPNARDK